MKKYFRSLFKFFSSSPPFVWKTLLTVFLLFFGIAALFAAYVYTGPRSLPTLALFLEERAKSYIPEQSTLKIENLEIENEKNSLNIITKAKGLRFEDPELGSFHMPEVIVYFDWFAVIPGSTHSFVNFNFKSPQWDLSKQIQENNFDPKALAKLNLYFEKNKYKLQNLGFALENLSFEYEVLGQNRKIDIHELHLNPVVVDGRLLFELSSELSLDGLEQDLNIEMGIDDNLIQMETKIEVGDAVFEGEFKISYVDHVPGVKGTFLAKHFNLDLLKVYWPQNIGVNARNWVFDHIKNVEIYAADGNIQIPKYDKNQPLEKDAIEAALYLSNTELQYMDNVPKVEGISGLVHISAHDLKFEVEEARILQSKLSKVVGSIPDFNAENKSLELSGRVEGPVQDGVDLTFAHIVKENTRFKNMDGNAVTDLSLSIPLSEKATLSKLNLNIHSTMSQVSTSKVFRDFESSKGTFVADLKSNVFKVQGDSALNGKVPVHLEYVHNLLDEEKIYLLKSKLDWDDLSVFGKLKPEYFSEKVSIEFYRNMKGPDEKTVIQMDLVESRVMSEFLNLDKKPGEEGIIRVDLHSKMGANPTLNYFVKLNGLESKGTGYLEAETDEVLSLESSSTTIKKKDGVGSFDFTYKKPKLRLSTNEAGELFKALNLSKKMSRGHLVFNGDLSPQLKGDLTIENFEVQEFPFAVKVLSVASLSGIRSLLSTKGLGIKNLESSFNYENGVAQIHKLKMKGDIFQGTLKGVLYTKEQTIKGKGNIIPSNILNTLVKKIAKKKIGAPIAVQFDVEGALGDPEVKVHAFSDISNNLD